MLLYPYHSKLVTLGRLNKWRNELDNEDKTLEKGTNSKTKTVKTPNPLPSNAKLEIKRMEDGFSF